MKSFYIYVKINMTPRERDQIIHHILCTYMRSVISELRFSSLGTTEYSIDELDSNSAKVALLTWPMCELGDEYVLDNARKIVLISFLQPANRGSLGRYLICLRWATPLEGGGRGAHWSC
jgi:hypothetical protein